MSFTHLLHYSYYLDFKFFILYYLGNNKISVIGPEIFSSLIKLKELQLFKNKISVIPPEIGLLKGSFVSICLILEYGNNLLK